MTSFDPLHRWLGIPPEEQPPTHYRLLGLKPFEANPDVIEAAADQRMAYVRQCSTGKYSSFSQPVLNGLAAARVCLLDPQKKVAYDAQLQAQLVAAEARKSLPVAVPLPAAAIPTTPMTPTPATEAPSHPFPIVTAHPSGSPAYRRRSSQNAALLYGVVGLVLIVLIAGGVLFGTGAFKPEPPVAQVPAQPKPKGGQSQATKAANLPRAPQTAAQAKVPAEVPKATDLPMPMPMDLPNQPSSLKAVSGNTNLATRPVSQEVEIPVVRRAKGDKVLLICPPDELEVAKAACTAYGLDYEQAGFDASRTDYSGIHAILCGSSMMDYWGADEQRKRPEAFQPIERFVASGGHLLVCGTFNGSNMEHMQRFGITTGFQHCSRFLPVEEHTKVLFQGVEELVPQDRQLRSVGNFAVARPHVALLMRDDKKPEPTPMLATLPFEKGRVTFTQVEPNRQGDLWLIRVLLNWVARGAPTRASDEALPLELANSNPSMSRSLGDLVTPDSTSDSPAPARLPVPAEADLKTAKTAIASAYRDRLQTAKSAASKRVVMQAMIDDAESAVAEPVTYYALLQEAYDQAMLNKDAASAIAILDKLSARFEFDVAERKVDTLNKLARGAKDAASSRILAGAILDVMADLVDQDAFDEAARLSNVASAAATRSQVGHFKTLSSYAEKRVKLLQREYEAIAEQVEKLRQSSDDPRASLIVGKFRCFFQRDWERGLPLLAMSGDVSLASLAKRDLAPQTGSAGALQLADDWYALAETLEATERAAAYSKARHWYYVALVGATGLTKPEIEAKLRKIPSARVQWKVHVEAIDGKDDIIITPDALTWHHREWALPTGAVINDFPWALRDQGVLKNRGATQFLPADVDLTTIRVEKVGGRAEVSVEGSPTRAVIALFDPPPGVGDCDFIITFGR